VEIKKDETPITKKGILCAASGARSAGGGIAIAVMMAAATPRAGGRPAPKRIVFTLIQLHAHAIQRGPLQTRRLTGISILNMAAVKFIILARGTDRPNDMERKHLQITFPTLYIQMGPKRVHLVLILVV